MPVLEANICAVQVDEEITLLSIDTTVRRPWWWCLLYPVIAQMSAKYVSVLDS